ncbi:hypothetical protein FRC10_005315 [Ceratobasidium sp. 414]|nr:hypothetical protein FRC10_005315 [Ceratobasidium sp. 414]
MAYNDDPPWLRPAPTLALPTGADKGTPISPEIAETKSSSAPSPSSGMPSPLTRVPQLALPSASSSSASEDGHAGWRPQPIATQQAAQAPPLSPLDLAMYPGAPVGADPAAARQAVAGLRPLRILSSRRPGGPSSAGPSRPPGVSSASSLGEASRASFMGFLSAAKRVSGVAVSGPSSYSTPRTSTQSLPASRAPIPVSPPPPPRTPPLVPPLCLAPDLVNQIEPALKAYLESLVAQAASKPTPPTSSSLPRRDSSSRVSQPGPIGLTEEDEDIILEIRDLDAGRVISIRNLDAGVVNRESQSTSQRLPTISEFMVVRDLDAQPHTPRPAPPSILQAPRPPTPPLCLSPTQLLSPILLAPDPHKLRQSRPVTLLTEAAYLNRDLEASLFDLERANTYAYPPDRSHY